MAILQNLASSIGTCIAAANALLAITLIAAVGLLFALPLKNRPAPRYAILRAALVLIMLAPFAAVALHSTGFGFIQLHGEVEPPIEQPMVVRPAATEAIPQFQMNFFESARPVTDPEKVLSTSNLLKEPESAAVPPAAAGVSILPRLRIAVGIALLVWCLIAIALVARLACSWLKLRSTVRDAKLIADNRIQLLANEIARSLGISRVPRLATSRRVASPIVAGLWRPTLILPESLAERISDAQLRDVLIHELAHVARRDLIVVVLQNLAAAAFWPHPLVHYLNRQLARAREEICDNYVLNVSDAPQFSRTLLTVAEFIHGRAAPPMSLAMFTSTWRLESRVAGLLNKNRSRLTRLSRRGKTTVAALTLMLTILAACCSVALAQTTGAKPSATNAFGSSSSAPATKAAKYRAVEDRRDPDLVVQKAIHDPDIEQLQLPESIGNQIRKLAGVAKVAGGLMDVVSFPEHDLNEVFVLGIAPDSPLFGMIKVQPGGRILNVSNMHDVLLGTSLAGKLKAKVGGTIPLYGERFDVVGIFESKNDYENLSIIMPLREMQREMNRPKQVTGFLVWLAIPKDATPTQRAAALAAACQKIKAIDPSLAVGSQLDRQQRR